MNRENSWTAKNICLNESGNLVIEAKPSYGNRKKWKGEMEFHITATQLIELLDQVEEQKAKKQTVETAVAELKDFEERQKADYHKEMESLAKKLNLSVEDIPTPWHW